jgi:hypothetical protein
VDKFGVPRVRCYCGNPLKEPIPLSVAPTYTGETWPAFKPTTVVVVVAPPQPVTTIVVIDVVTGLPFSRQLGGGDVITDTDAPPGIFGTPTATPAPTPTPTPTPLIAQNITSIGRPAASSTFSGFPASNAVDGNRATSWFSNGASEGENSTFTWTARQPVVVTTVSILSNAQNSNPSIRQGYTFTSVTIQVLDGSGNVVASKDSPMGDSDVTVDFGGVAGVVVRAILHHHVNPACGGFSELVVMGTVVA